MMQSAEERYCLDLPNALNCASDRRVLVQRKVSPHLIVIGWEVLQL
jgi:hypothetical protein